MRKDLLMVIAAGGVLGIVALVLVELGNPANMGFCLACFERDVVGALGFFANGPKYIRPEIIGIVLGGFLTALAYKEFKPRGGSAPALRFLLGMFMMVGALVFLGCPTRLILRLGGGDLNAVLGLVGFALGIGIGVYFLRKGFNLGRAGNTRLLDGLVMPAFMVALLLLILLVPSFVEGGPIRDIMAAKGHPGGEGSIIPSLSLGVIISLIGGLIVGCLGQRSRLCFAGGLRDLMLMRSWHLISGIIALFAVMVIGNLILGNFTIGLADQPITLWQAGSVGWSVLLNIGGMMLVGIAATLLGGCPFRQLVLTGNGNTDATVTVFGMLAGAAVAHNFGLVAGATIHGKLALLLGILLAILIAALNRDK